jgi:two-component system sensor histidine kinase ChiS
MKKILVIDDEYSVRAAVRICLAAEGYAVVEAENGKMGLELARADKPDLVLCDVRMGAVSGFDVIKGLQSQPDTATIPVILMTGVPEAADVRRSMEQGADDYLAKPFETKALRAAIRARLERHESIQARFKEELEKANRELVEASRLAGMAEVATGVLHNIGNALNSVTTASSCLAVSVTRSKAANLGKVVELLRKHQADLGAFLTSDPKGKQILDFLASLNDQLAGEQATALQQLAQLQKTLEHIRKIVSVQQDYARLSSSTEEFRVAELVEDALRMTAAESSAREVEIVRDLDSRLTATADRQKALQILVNLVSNAQQACSASNRGEKRIIIRANDEADRVRLAVIDTGTGILPENLDRIFTYGFTTKKNGHGFGLHSSARAAKELGGTLHVQSDGPGKGATFTLELPRPR